MRTQQPETCTECGAVASERNRYFTGKYMTARDFDADQAYFLSRHRLHNRLLHGWGIVCGLRVVPHPNVECAGRWVVIRAGIAIDCCGRELVLGKDVAFELPLPLAEEPASGRSPPAQGSADEHPSYRSAEPEPANLPEYNEEPKQYPREPEPEPEPEPEQEQEQEQEPDLEELLLCLTYEEKLVEHVPSLYAEGECDPTRHEANRVRELTRVEVRRLDDVHPDCWRSPEGSLEVNCRDDCGHDLPSEPAGCLEPECPCGRCVPLAVITYDPAEPELGFSIDLSGRRLLPPPADHLTHIVGFSWPHGGELSLDELVEQDGRLEIRFDRKLAPARGEATGVNEFTFVTQYGSVQRDLEFLPGLPELDPDDPCVAVFHIDRDYYEPRARRDSIAGSSVYVTLKCDFIPDCHGNPVSGRHLDGVVPTGDGRPGGLFESWFRVVAGGGAKEA